MKQSFYTAAILILTIIFSNVQSNAQGTWTPVAANAPGESGGGMLLLTDGTVLAKSFDGSDSYGNTYYRLTPNSNGSYINGTWSAIAPMHFTRLYYSSQILKDGRVYVAGGEYGTGHSLAETYDPVTNVWTNTPAPGSVSDANSEILEDGRVLQALVTGTLKGNVIYNPVTNTYSAGPSCIGIHNESAWVKLPDNSVLMVDRNSTASERYIPALNQWVADATVPVALYDPFGFETGGAVMLPDGRAFFIGSLGHNAFYTPSGNNNPGTWAAAADFPSGKGTPDAAAAMMVNGKILCAVSPVPTSGNHFPSPTSFYEYDYVANSFTSITTPSGASTINEPCYVVNMLTLPDGTVLVSNQDSARYYVYTPSGSPLAAGKPTISNIIQNSCTSFTITGTKFNGISQGATYGDDWQMSTNYPIVRLTSGANVYYARTFNWNSTGVQRGSAPDTTQFTLPAGLPAGTYSLVVVANGISSNPVSFSPLPVLSSSLTPPPICSSSAFTYTPTSTTGGATFTWTRAAVPGISNPAITTPQTVNPNEVLKNTTSNPLTVVYAYTINAAGCSNSQNVAVVVNPLPAAKITHTGSLGLCSGESVTLNAPNDANRTYQWRKGGVDIAGATSVSYIASIGGNYKVHVTNTVTGCDRTTANNTVVTVNPLPPATITPQGPTTFCAGGSVVLSANPGAGFTYQWKKNGTNIAGATNINYTATTAGTYKVKVTDSGCSKISGAVNVTVPCKNENDLITENDFNVTVYPNPSSGDFVLDFITGQNEMNKNISIQIYDVSGRLIQSDVTENSQFIIQNSQLTAGIYSAVISNGTQNRILKLVKTE